MSTFGIVRDVTRTFASGLDVAYAAEPLTAALSGQIFPESPASDGAGQNQKKISLWPYRLSRDEFLSNAPLQPLGPTLLGIPPLIVDVWYLLTPMSGSGDLDQLAIEKALEFVYDLQGPMTVDGIPTSTRLTFETPGADELFRLWSAMDTPYALSCIFCARSVAIDSLRAQQSANRVLERYDRYATVQP